MCFSAAVVSGLVLIALVAPALAGSLTVWPVAVTLRADGKAQVVNLTNEGDADALVQVEMFAWNNDADVERMQPTRDLLAVPPVFEVGARSSQVIRIALRKPLESSQEATYRLVITEVPREVGAAEGISFVLRLNLPVFVTPEGAAPAPAWSLERDGGGARLTLGNQGSAHVRVRSVELFQDGSVEPVFVSDEGGYVLAGRERSWQLDLGRLKTGASLTVKAETDRGEIEAPVDIGG